MLLKIGFLLFTGAVLVHCQETPAELKAYFNDIDTEVRYLQSEAIVQIQTNIAPLETYIVEAETDITQNLTDAAKPYWATIRSLEETAAEEGQDISNCINAGNNEFYTLNSTIVEPAYMAFNHYNTVGQEMLKASSSEANNVIQELNVLGEVVTLCSDAICATSLKKTVTQYYQRAKHALNDAELRTSSYVTIYLPPLLAQYSLDSKSYVTKYTVILDNVNICING